MCKNFLNQIILNLKEPISRAKLPFWVQVVFSMKQATLKEILYQKRLFYSKDLLQAWDTSSMLRVSHLRVLWKDEQNSVLYMTEDSIQWWTCKNCFHFLWARCQLYKVHCGKPTHVFYGIFLELVESEEVDGVLCRTTLLVGLTCLFLS